MDSSQTLTSNTQDLTFEICTPSCRCAPPHSIQSVTPRFRDAHSGSASPQSQHSSLPGVPRTRASVSRGSHSGSTLAPPLFSVSLRVANAGPPCPPNPLEGDTSSKDVSPPLPLSLLTVDVVRLWFLVPKNKLVENDDDLEWPRELVPPAAVLLFPLSPGEPIVDMLCDIALELLSKPATAAVIASIHRDRSVSLSACSA
mmetsp:Transcript_14250/g.47266  ORF Transcript_14250/g.47266 Transcript_14250/m.47266 type:complete len:200 (+) Transcript_14250:681-1280(+)